MAGVIINWISKLVTLKPPKPTWLMASKAVPDTFCFRWITVAEATFFKESCQYFPSEFIRWKHCNFPSISWLTCWFVSIMSSAGSEERCLLHQGNTCLLNVILVENRDALNSYYLQQTYFLLLRGLLSKTYENYMKTPFFWHAIPRFKSWGVPATSKSIVIALPACLEKKRTWCKNTTGNWIFWY